uniref:Uncharacterized protein n=1 Tax=Arundo donax TaxID=35708 RepID=A0A0A8ZWP7_ARUDO
MVLVKDTINLVREKKDTINWPVYDKLDFICTWDACA